MSVGHNGVLYKKTINVLFGSWTGVRLRLRVLGGSPDPPGGWGNLGFFLTALENMVIVKSATIATYNIQYTYQQKALGLEMYVRWQIHICIYMKTAI